MTKRLQGQIALVTGGSRGIGRAICEALAKEGADIYVNYTRGQEAAEETVKICQSYGVNAFAIGFDVSSSEAVKKAFDEIKEKSEKIDILVNNAGVAVDGIFIRMKEEEIDQVLKINLYGSIFCAQAAAKMMMRKQSGKIINISSVVGQMGNAGQASYVSSKAGVIGLTKSLARELASRNITVNAVAPGFIETDMTRDLSEEVRKEHLKFIPLEKYGKPEDVASLVVFLASNEASYITGQIIAVNGGMYM